MRAIPLPVRERIIHLYEQGKSTDDIAAFFGFCVAAVRRVRQQFKARGTLHPQTHRCGRKTLLTVQRKARLQKLVAQQPDATLAELGSRMDRPFRTSTMDLWLRRLGLTYKKNAAPPRAKPPRRSRQTGRLARVAGRGAAAAEIVRSLKLSQHPP